MGGGSVFLEVVEALGFSMALLDWAAGGISTKCDAPAAAGRQCLTKVYWTGGSMSS